MRPYALLATLIVPTLLGGCAGSGVYAHLYDTIRLPGSNPNRPKGSGENYALVRAHKPLPLPPPLLAEGGNVWPGPPAMPPTLKEMQTQQNQEANGALPAGLKPLAPLPQLPGYEVPEQQVGSPVPESTFPGGNVGLPHARALSTGEGTSVPPVSTSPNGNLIVPNGNGTSTVIAPNGAVSTIKTPP